MTNQATVPHGATATDPSGGSISSLVGYALSTLLVVVAVTGVALTVARDDPSASGVPGDRAAAATAASYAARAQAQTGIVHGRLLRRGGGGAAARHRRSTPARTSSPQSAAPRCQGCRVTPRSAPAPPSDHDQARPHARIAG